MYYSAFPILAIFLQYRKPPSRASIKCFGSTKVRMTVFFVIFYSNTYGSERESTYPSAMRWFRRQITNTNSDSESIVLFDVEFKTRILLLIASSVDKALLSKKTKEVTVVTRPMRKKISKVLLKLRIKSNSKRSSNRPSYGMPYLF